MNAKLSLVLSFAAGAAALVMSLGAAVPAGTPSGPLNVLVIYGGGFHDFAGNLSHLIAGMPLPPDTHFTSLALGAAGAPGGVAGAPAGASGAPGGFDALTMPQVEALAAAGPFDVILAYTQGELGLTPSAKNALLAYVSGGGGFVGLHSAADSHPGWEEYTEMLGARFETHPPFGPVTVQLMPGASAHPVTSGLPAVWTLSDEFYHLKDLHLESATILMSGVSPAGGKRRPVTWAKPYGQGRVVYTILGHGPDAELDVRYQQLVAQALLWASGRG